MLTRDYQANLLKRFGGPDDTVLSFTEYKNRHDMMGQYLHWKMCHFHGKETAWNWHEYHSEPVTDTKPVIILGVYNRHKQNNQR